MVLPLTSLIYVIYGCILTFCRFSDVFLTLHSVSHTNFLSSPANNGDLMAPQNYKTFIVQNDVNNILLKEKKIRILPLHLFQCMHFLKYEGHCVTGTSTRRI